MSFWGDMRVVVRPEQTADPSAPPDFLLRAVSPVKFVRLSSRRGAYVAAVECCE